LLLLLQHCFSFFLQKKRKVQRAGTLWNTQRATRWNAQCAGMRNALKHATRNRGTQRGH
jgi:hypothetical protein